MIKKLLLGLTCTAFAGLVTMPANAIFFADRASFDAAAPGLPIEDFENTIVPAGQRAVCGRTIGNVSNDACFTPGGLNPAVSLTPPNGRAMTIINQLSGFPSAVAGPDASFPFLRVNFISPGLQINALAMDVFSFGPATFKVSVFGGGKMIAFTNVSPAGGASSAFFGTIQPEIISFVQFESTGDPTGASEFVDNIAFRLVKTTTTNVPEPASAALFAFGLTGIAAFRRRRKTA